MTAEAWTVLGGSATGASHIAAGIGCQDAHAWFVGRRACCFAVADGAGSRPRSAAGSVAAVESAVQTVRAAAASAVPSVEELFGEARARLEGLASDEGCDLDEFATTLAVVVITDDAAEVGQVGDTIAVVRDEGGALRAIAPAEKFEYANETTFLSGRSWRDHLRVERLASSSISGVALSTDGLRFKILDDLTEGTPFAPFFEDVFAWFDSDAATPDAVARFIDRLDDQSGDDKTLVVAARRGTCDQQQELYVVNQHVAEWSVETMPPAPDQGGQLPGAENGHGDETADSSV